MRLQVVCPATYRFREIVANDAFRARESSGVPCPTSAPAEYQAVVLKGHAPMVEFIPFSKQNPVRPAADGVLLKVDLFLIEDYEPSFPADSRRQL